MTSFFAWVRATNKYNEKDTEFVLKYELNLLGGPVWSGPFGSAARCALLPMNMPLLSVKRKESPKSNSKMGRTEVTYKTEGCYMHGGHITRTMMPTLKTTASKQWPNQ